ncbi:helix-turn-helix domain-containing protein [Aestuariicella sp. G3-2]|uniref:helix-turn-helix domain-containing protein n=1 Tax=Pseudomaricurvus albidus TaxID=2842452 RepID=UPI001C0C802C|nr:helix-turn-helix domain-containing protein [Aestuariicella albida]MBU3069487.1 helix-turn-helix domain-containing protein [Aestuariicella albida]
MKSRINMPSYYSIDDKILPISQIPAAMLELARNHRMDINSLLKGTGIFMQDISRRDYHISCEQLKCLINNISKHNHSQEFALRFGRQLPYINHSTLLQAIVNASCIRDLLEILRNHCRLYYPLCFLHLASDTKNHYLIINDAIGCPQQQKFISQSFISSVLTLLKASDIDKNQLTFYLEQSQPEDTAPLQTYLGSRICYNAPITAIIVPDHIGQKPLSNHSETIKQQALIECQESIQLINGKQGFLECLQKLLLRKIPRQDITLQICAEHFGISSATFKRRLKAHQTNFQSELDRARKLLALSLLVIQDLNNEEVARILRINDSANFRRSFKRWTGSLPSTLRHQLADPQNLHF